MNAPTNGVKSSFITQAPFSHLGHESQVHAQEALLFQSRMCDFTCMQHYPKVT